MNLMSIRSAQKEDVIKISELIYTTENYPEILWGGSTKQECIKNISFLILNDKSRYNLKYISVAQKDNNMVGVLIAIPYYELTNLNISTDITVFKFIKGLRNKLRFIIEEIIYFNINECDKGDLYIANLATDEKLRGLGIGKFLMKYAEKLARDKKCFRCSLIAKDITVTKFYNNIKYNKILDKTILGYRIIKMSKMV